MYVLRELADSDVFVCFLSEVQIKIITIIIIIYFLDCKVVIKATLLIKYVYTTIINLN